MMKKRGQSTLEYVILLAGVTIFFISFVGKRNSVLQQRLEEAHDDVAGEVTKLSSRFANSHPSKDETK